MSDLLKYVANTLAAAALRQPESEEDTTEPEETFDAAYMQALEDFDLASDLLDYPDYDYYEDFCGYCDEYCMFCRTYLLEPHCTDSYFDWDAHDDEVAYRISQEIEEAYDERDLVSEVPIEGCAVAAIPDPFAEERKKHLTSKARKSRQRKRTSLCHKRREWIGSRFGTIPEEDRPVNIWQWHANFSKENDRAYRQKRIEGRAKDYLYWQLASFMN